MAGAEVCVCDEQRKTEGLENNKLFFLQQVVGAEEDTEVAAAEVNIFFYNFSFTCQFGWHQTTTTLIS